MPKSHSRLRLIAFDQDDYGIAKSITTTDDPLQAAESAQALSLYFQWPEYRSALAGTGKTTCHISCQIDYDQDARVPDELFVRCNATELPADLSVNSQIFIRFEVFRNMFEFEAEVLAMDQDQDQDHNGGDNLLTIAMPKVLHRLSNRRLPRLQLTATEASQLGSVIWSGLDGVRVSAVVSEIGLSSVAISTAVPIHGLGSIQFSSDGFKAEVLRATDTSTVLRPILDTATDFGRYFDLYRRVAYPMLVPRPDLPYEKIVELYDKTRYFGKFDLGTSLAERGDVLVSAWSKIDRGFHISTADYAGINEQGVVSGTSGLGLAFMDGDTQYWAMHQLCALTEPALLELTGALYCWRAEYLAARPENLNAFAWFDSRSRWLERIYVKYGHNRGNHANLHAVAVARIECSPHPNITPPSGALTLKIGDCERYTLAEPGLLAGASPRFFNASAILDCIVNLSAVPDTGRIQDLGMRLATLVGTPRLALEVTTAKAAEVNLPGAQPINDVDRYFAISKAELVPFLTSVEHSIAVTRRKWAGGRRVP